jgi:hypothetical protein
MFRLNIPFVFGEFKIKAEVGRMCTLKTYGGSRVISPPIINIGAG